MAIRRCPYCKAIIDESQKYCNNCGTQLLFPNEEPGDEPIKGEKITDADFPGDGSDRLPGGEIDEIRDDVDIDLEADEEREEIDLDKVIDGEVSLSGNTGEDMGMIDLRETEPAPEEAAEKAESVSIDKPVAVEEGPPPDIRLPESSEPEKTKAARPGRSLSRRRKDEVLKPKPADEAAEKPPKLTPHRDGPVPSKMKDQDTKFQIARLIADFERKRREYTTDLEPPKDEVADEPIVPPTAEEIGEPPKPEDLEKEAEALLAGTEGDFATDYEFEIGKKDPGTADPGSLDERLSRLVGGFNSAVESGAEAEEEKRGETAHPEFMTGDLPEEEGSGKMEVPAPAELPDELPDEDRSDSRRPLAFVTQDFEEEPQAPPDMGPEAPLSRQDIVLEEQPKTPVPIEPPAPIPFEPPTPTPAPPPPPGSSDERAALIARILKNRAERMGRADQSRVSKETSDALAALQSSNAAEQAKVKEPEKPKEPEEPEIEVKPVETGEIRKPEEPAETEEPEERIEPEEEELPIEDREGPKEFLTDAWKTPSEDLPAVPTMGFPEELPKTSTSIPFDAPSAELEPEPTRSSHSAGSRPSSARPAGRGQGAGARSRSAGHHDDRRSDGN